MERKVTTLIIAVSITILCEFVFAACTNVTAKVEEHLKIGNKYLLEGKYEEAILAFQKVIDIEPKSVPARLGLGKVYMAIGEFSKAETVLKEIINIEPKNISVREYLFEIHLKENNVDMADSDLQEIIKIDSSKDVKQFSLYLNTAKAINTSKGCYEQGIKQMNDKQYLEAVDSFQKVIKEDSERYADAQKKIIDCKKAFIDDALQNAKALASNKDYQIALNLLEQVLKVDSNNQDALKMKNNYTKIIESQNSQIIIENKNSTAGKTTANDDSILYENKKYGFTLNIPKNWEGRFFIDEKDYTNMHNIYFMYKGKDHNEYIFIIHIFNGKKEDLNIPEQLSIFGAKNDIIFFNSVPQDTKYKATEYQDFSKMLRDRSNILKTFKLI